MQPETEQLKKIKHDDNNKMPQKLNMQRPSLLRSMQLIALLILSCSYIVNHAFAFTSCSPPAIASRNIATVNIRIQQPPSTKLHYSTNNNNNNNDNNTPKKNKTTAKSASGRSFRRALIYQQGALIYQQAGGRAGRTHQSLLRARLFVIDLQEA